MKSETVVAITSIAMWLGVTAAVITALIVTHRLSVFWFYIIPALSGYTTQNVSNKEKTMGGEK